MLHSEADRPRRVTRSRLPSLLKQTTYYRLPLTITWWGCPPERWITLLSTELSSTDTNKLKSSSSVTPRVSKSPRYILFYVKGTSPTTPHIRVQRYYGAARQKQNVMVGVCVVGLDRVIAPGRMWNKESVWESGNTSCCRFV